MLPDAFQDVHRVLAVRLDNIGDVIMLGPALRALKAVFPAAHLTLMASSAGSQVAPMLPWVDDVLTWRAVWQEIKGSFDQGPEKEHELVEILREGRYDAAFLFTSFSQSPYPPAYACYLAGIPLRIGQSKEFGGYLLTHWVRAAEDSDYQVDRNLHLISSVGLPVQDNHIELHVPEADQQAANDLLGNFGLAESEPYILAAPGASAAARRYDPERFATVIDGLAKTIGQAVLVVGTEREREKGILEPSIRTAKRNPQIHTLIGQTSVAELAALINRASLVIANNSASLHMAEAFGRPMVILYSGTEYLTQWAPRYSPALILNRSVSCSPCFAFTCPYQMQCLDIPPREVIEETLRFIDHLPVLAHSDPKYVLSSWEETK